MSKLKCQIKSKVQNQIPHNPPVVIPGLARNPVGGMVGQFDICHLSFIWHLDFELWIFNYAFLSPNFILGSEKV